MCYYHHACFLVCLSLLSVIETSMDDSGHKGNTVQLLNSRVLEVHDYDSTLTMTQVSVCQSQSKLSQNS